MYNSGHGLLFKGRWPPPPNDSNNIMGFSSWISNKKLEVYIFFEISINYKNMVRNLTVFLGEIIDILGGKCKFRIYIIFNFKL